MCSHHQNSSLKKPKKAVTPTNSDDHLQDNFQVWVPAITFLAAHYKEGTKSPPLVTQITQTSLRIYVPPTITTQFKNRFFLLVPTPPTKLWEQKWSLRKKTRSRGYRLRMCLSYLSTIVCVKLWKGHKAFHWCPIKNPQVKSWMGTKVSMPSGSH